MLTQSVFWVFALYFVSAVRASSPLDVLVNQTIHAIESAVDCTTCHTLLLVPFKGLAETGDTTFVDVLTQVCILINLEEPSVCQGLMAEEGPIVAHVLRSIDPLGTTATKFCETLIGLCDSPPVRPYNVSFPKPAPPSGKPAVLGSGRTPFRVVHITDVHIDREYTPGTEADCNEPICCRPSSSSPSAPIVSPAGPNGEHTCDTPNTLVESYFEAIQEFGADASFAVFTGDVVEASIWLVTENGNIGDMHDFNANMSSKLTIPVYGSIGNHEAAPVNSFPRSTTVTNLSSQWVFDTQAADWTRWIGASAADQLQHQSGSYSIVVPNSNLRIISLNTMYYYRDNFWLFDSDEFQPDPNGVLAFMISNLQAAEDAGQRAWIIGHVPPGGSDALYDQSNYYDQIIQRYKGTIAASFFGHSHRDEFEIAYSDYNDQSASTATSVAFIAPALTPRQGNPELRIYDIDPDTYEVMDFTLYIANMSSPTYQETITWEKFYSARESYGPLIHLAETQSFNAAVMHNLTDVFENDDEAFAMFNERYWRDFNVTECTGACKSQLICGMRAMRAENNCFTPTPGFDFNKREPKRVLVESECGGSMLGSVLRGVVGGNVGLGQSVLS